MEQEGHNKLQAFGTGKHMQRNDVERFVRKLVLDDILGEEITVTVQDMTVAYLKIGRRAYDLLNGRIQASPAAAGYLATFYSIQINHVPIINDDGAQGATADACAFVPSAESP